MNPSLDAIRIGNPGLFAGLTGSIGAYKPLKESLPRIFICDQSMAITEVPGATTLDIIVIGGGGGGGGGRLETTALTAAGGGGGGGGAAVMSMSYSVDLLVFPLIVAIGAGGSGGTGPTGTTANGGNGSNGGITQVFASGIVGGEGFQTTTINTLVSLARADGGFAANGGGAGAGGAGGSHGNTDLTNHLSFLGTSGQLGGGFPTAIQAADAGTANPLVPRSGAGGAGISAADGLGSFGSRTSSGNRYFWSINTVSMTGGLNAPRFPRLLVGGYPGTGGAASLTDGQKGGDGWRGSGGCGGGAGRVSGGAGGNGGNGVAYLIFR